MLGDVVVIDGNEVIEEIEIKKRDITYAIAKAIFGEDELKFNHFYNDFYAEIKKCNIFFLNSKSFLTSYEKRIVKLIKNINSVVGYELYSYNFGNITMNNEYKNVFEDTPFDKVDVLDDLINKLNKEMHMYSFKKKMFFYKELISVYFLDFFNDEFLKTYNIKNFDDLMNLYTEASSFECEENSLVIEKNKCDFRKRINAKDDYVPSKKEIKKIKESINVLMNNDFYNQFVKESKIDEFLKKNNYPISQKNIKALFRVYLLMIDAEGVCVRKDFGDGLKNYCFFDDSLLKYDSKTINNIIIHEFIHSLQGIYGDNENSFQKKYVVFNEALTEYFAKKSLIYLPENIIEKSYEKDKTDNILYECMFPLLKKMEKSSVWEDVVMSKIYDDASIFEKRVGRINAYQIKECFEKVIDNPMDRNTVNISLLCLNGILKRIDKNRLK